MELHLEHFSKYTKSNKGVICLSKSDTLLSKMRSCEFYLVLISQDLSARLFWPSKHFDDVDSKELFQL